MAAGLYLHIPFCKSRCSYCDFFSVTQTGHIPAFVAALGREIELYRGTFDNFDTLYLGGGTPSLLSIAQITNLLQKIDATFALQPGAEITLEANPADLGRAELRALRGLGVNRINIGIQSTDERELVLLGRRHDRAQALAALTEARAAGFDNIGADLIYNLPGQTLEGWLAILAEITDLEPEHLSCYELEIKPATPLGRRYARGEFAQRPDAEQREFFLRTSEFLQDRGYIHYEVSNFARTPQYFSRHNRKYWDHTPYLGLGPAAHSFRPGPAPGTGRPEAPLTGQHTASLRRHHSRPETGPHPSPGAGATRESGLDDAPGPGPHAAPGDRSSTAAAPPGPGDEAHPAAAAADNHDGTLVIAERWWNHATLEGYLAALERGRRPLAGRETLGPEELHTEALFLGLRTTAGIDLERHRRRYGHDLLREKGPILETWAAAGLVVITSGVLRPTRAGLAVADGLALL